VMAPGYRAGDRVLSLLRIHAPVLFADLVAHVFENHEVGVHESS